MNEDPLAPPALSVPLRDSLQGIFGRLYRLPDDGAPPVGVSQSDILRNVQSGVWMPSITNILDVQSKPFLIKWATKLAIKEAINTERNYPGRILAAPYEATKYLSSTHERDVAQAADLGSRVHFACEKLALGLPVPKDLIDPSEQGYIDAWLLWRDTFKPEFRNVELSVFGETDQGHKYAGTTDFVCTINDTLVAGDIKTTRSGIHAEVAYQLTAVTKAHSCVSTLGTGLQDMPDIQAGHVLHLGRDGSFAFPPVKVAPETWQVFCGLRQAWEARIIERVDGGVILPGIASAEGVVPQEGIARLSL